MLAEVRRLLAVLTLPCTDQFCLSEDLGHLYFFANRFYWAETFHFEARVQDRRRLSAGWENVEFFTMRV